MYLAFAKKYEFLFLLGEPPGTTRLIIFAGLNIIFLLSRLIVLGVGFKSARVSVGDASASMSLENRAKNEEFPRY